METRITDATTGAIGRSVAKAKMDNITSRERFL
jgi:hypothetical protein